MDDLDRENEPKYIVVECDTKRRIIVLDDDDVTLADRAAKTIQNQYNINCKLASKSEDDWLLREDTAPEISRGINLYEFFNSVEGKSVMVDFTVGLDIKAVVTFDEKTVFKKTFGISEGVFAVEEAMSVVDRYCIKESK